MLSFKSTGDIDSWSRQLLVSSGTETQAGYSMKRALETWLTPGLAGRSSAVQGVAVVGHHRTTPTSACGGV